MKKVSRERKRKDLDIIVELDPYGKDLVLERSGERARKGIYRSGI